MQLNNHKYHTLKQDGKNNVSVTLQRQSHGKVSKTTGDQ
jgi:hypothetical protein